MSSARLSDSPKDSYFARAASPSSLKEGGDFHMELSASPGATGTGDEGGSPVRRARSRSLHAAVISLELKGEDRCLVRMDVSVVGVLRSTFFFPALRVRLKSSLERRRATRERERNSTEASTSFPLPFIPPRFLSNALRRLNLSSSHSPCFFS